MSAAAPPATSDLAKLRAPLAPWRPHLALEPEAASLVASCQTAADAIGILTAHALLGEAARVTAFALPPREAVWWACMCAAHTAPPDLPDTDRDAAEAAQAWVRRQSEAECRAAWDRAQRAGMQTPEAWCAVAAFWSGDSLSPPDVPKVPPAPHLPGTAVSGAVALAAVRRDPARRDRRLAAFLHSARDIAAGGAGRIGAEPD